jgi:RNA processing factor Prp31
VGRVKDIFNTEMYSTDSKLCAQQIIREHFESVLCSTFRIPTVEEMIAILQKNFSHDFDEYKSIQTIMRSHPEWEKEKVNSEMEREKEKYENELQVNLQVAALSTIDEIEKLITSLNNSIREWKIIHL